MGSFINDHNGVKYFEHVGVDEGFYSICYGRMQGGNGIIIMTNTANGGFLIPEIINSVAKVYGFKDLYHSPKTYKLAAIPDSTLISYTGDYQFASHNITRFYNEDHHFYIKPDGGGPAELFPASQNKFFCKLVELEIEFIKDEKGNVIKAVFIKMEHRKP